MMNSQLFLKWIIGFILIISIVVPNFADDVVPVLIWGGTNSGKLNSNPFEKTSQADLKDLVDKKLGESQPPVLVFVKTNFCTEDLTQHSKSLARLKQYKSFEYIPAVDSPLTIFKTLPYTNQSMEEELESVSEGQLVITEVTDLDSVAEIFDLIKKSTPHLVAALTGNYCSYRSERGKRAAEMVASNDTDVFLIETQRLLFYADHTPTLKINDSEPIDLGKVITNVTETGDATAASPLIVKMEFNAGNESAQFKATFDFEISVETSGYYTLRRVNMSRDDKFVASLGIRPALYWAYSFSYHCAQHTKFVNKTLGYTLSFENLQLQLDTKIFGDTYDCVGFSSIPIWSAIFVTAIIAIITLWGILMIMDIRTMDRFDDPKGKTISISATD
ncbi:hypothetical protein PV327_001153 [Microctonus hyperodae]|uniref:V-type proton ATPase subunit S1 n=1 Tax=Microctonus hyperodae TaxID=165561 RepID=A0AA39G852_MICHY|nr:hypothetical protein PV327_001153 [Microctonus hyperodae]